MTDGNPHRVAILGGGFGGLYAAKALKRAPVRVTLVDRRNFHLFQPLLYQVATGAVSPGEIASPLRHVLRRSKNTEVVMAEATDLDADARRLILEDGVLEYDTLVVATGSTHHYFGHPEWMTLAPGLKTIEDATGIRSRVLVAFEAAERQPDPEVRRAWLTFVIVGGGPTGVELAGALGEIANETLRNDFRRIDPSEANILLLEGGDRVLGTFPPRLSDSAERQLLKLGVRPICGALMTGLDPEGVTMRRGNRVSHIPARTVLWAAGVKASEFGRVLERRAGALLDRAGRVLVEPDLSVPGHPEILIIGDLANYSHQGGSPLPGVAPVAMQEGRYVAKLIRSRLRGEAPPPFKYRNRGNLATIGRAAAVADFGWLHFDGLIAWIVWLFVHLMYLVGFDNRLLVFIRWMNNYFTRKRGARLITGAHRVRVVELESQNK
ncbi:MAG: NAD(P)/FAD-dependent oxidoreductase [Bryobacteraceae bacterium]